MTRSKLTKGLVAGAAAVATLSAIPATASAQTYSPYGATTYYDACQRSTVNRSTLGGLAGAALGAAVGGKVAASGVRTEGAVLGGLLGAVVGHRVGKSSAACSSGAPAPYAQPAAPYGQPYAGAPYNSRPYGY